MLALLFSRSIQKNKQITEYQRFFIFSLLE
jgi:hypothetical protein